MKRCVVLLLTAVLLIPFNQANAQNLSPDGRISEAIAANEASPEVTRIAKDKLRNLAWRFRFLGAENAARHLEQFLGNSGKDIQYSQDDSVARTLSTYDDAEFSHNDAHQYALKRILPYLENQIRSGRREFPAEIPLSELGFTATGPERLQGPNVYEKGLVFGVPIFPPYKLNMAAAFGDFQGPHEGFIANVKVVDTKPGQKGAKMTLTFDVKYKWNDKYTFNNDENMSEWDRAAYYLEFVAIEAKSFKTTVIVISKVSSVIDLGDPKAGNNNPTTGGGQPNPTQPQRYRGVLKVPKDVPAWVTGKINNVEDVPYDIDGGSRSNPATNTGKRTNPEQNLDDRNPSENRSLTAHITPEKLKNLSAWRELLSFRAPTEIQRSVHSKGKSWAVHRVEDGVGDVNLDYYPIVVEKLPFVDGKEVRAEVVMEYLRRNMNSFFNDSRIAFAPLNLEDEKKWNSRGPLEAILQIDIELLLPLGVADVPLGVTDLAMVVVSQRTAEEWVFSTVRGASGSWAINDTDAPGAHPVSGNRAFGFRKDAQDDTYIFYTMGADRTTRGMDLVGSPAGLRMTDRLWRSYQQGVVEFINRYGGVARVDYENTISQRHDWDEFKNDPAIYDATGQPEWLPVPK